VESNLSNHQSPMVPSCPRDPTVPANIRSKGETKASQGRTQIGAESTESDGCLIPTRGHAVAYGLPRSKKSRDAPGGSKGSTGSASNTVAEAVQFRSPRGARRARKLKKRFAEKALLNLEGSKVPTRARPSPARPLPSNPCGLHGSLPPGCLEMLHVEDGEDRMQEREEPAHTHPKVSVLGGVQAVRCKEHGLSRMPGIPPLRIVRTIDLVAATRKAALLARVVEHSTVRPGHGPRGVVGEHACVQPNDASQAFASGSRSSDDEI
jgi:hypothetical protein